MGKITFACYMTHYPYLVWRSLVGYLTPYMSTGYGLVYGVSETIPIVFVGFVVAVIFEFPIAAILDDLTGKRKREVKKELKEVAK